MGTTLDGTAVRPRRAPRPARGRELLGARGASRAATSSRCSRSKLAALGPTDGLEIVGVLYKDQPDLARAFLDDFGATWPSVDDPDGAIATAYRVVAPPQTYFIDKDGILRGIQIGEVPARGLRHAVRQDRPVTGHGAPSPRSSRRRAAQGATAAGTCSTGVSFEVARGELFALLGPNGAGKTTTVEILEGYRRADARHASGCSGLDPAGDGPALRRRIGLMLQEGGIDPRTTPREVLHLYARFFRDPEDPDAAARARDLGRRRRPATGGSRAARSSGWASRWPSWAGPELLRPRRADRRHGPGGQAGDPRADRGAARRRHDDPAHDPRAGRRRAARRSGRGARPRADRGRGDAGRADRRGGAAGPVPADRPLDAADAAALVAALGARGRGSSTSALARGYELRGLARRRTPRLVAALAAWCAERGLLLAELRVGAASLEERYLELVGRTRRRGGRGAGPSAPGTPGAGSPAAPRRGRDGRSRSPATSCGSRCAGARTCSPRSSSRPGAARVFSALDLGGSARAAHGRGPRPARRRSPSR